MSEAKSSSQNSVITAAVAGNLETRKLRACIAKATCPYLDNRVATGGAVAFNREKGLGIPPPLEMMGAKKMAVEKALLATGMKEEDLERHINSIKPIVKFQTNQNDTVLIIGQVCFKYFNKACKPLLSEINSSSVYVMGGAQGDDFNISNDGIQLLKNNNGEENVAIVASEDCPTYRFVDQWKPLLSNYEPIALNIHNVAVAAFLTSRTDGAFYRQFGLADMAHDQEGKGGVIINFERELAKKVKSSDKFSQKIKDQIKDQMDAIISHCDSNENPDYGEDKAGGKEDVYTTLYSMWSSALNATDPPKLMTPLTKLILETLIDVGSPGAKEYDGYTTAKMLYDKAGRSADFGPRSHYTDLVNLFQDGTCAPAWKAGLDAILSKGNLYVYHDAGLDPFVDDYIALKILNAAKGQEFLGDGGVLGYRAKAMGQSPGSGASKEGGRRRRKSRKKTRKKKRKSKKRRKRKRRKTKRKRKKRK